MAIDFSPIISSINFDVVAASLVAIFASIGLVVVAWRGGELLLRSIGGDAASIERRRVEGRGSIEEGGDWAQHPDTGRWFDSTNTDHHDENFQGFDRPTYEK